MLHTISYRGDLDNEGFKEYIKNVLEKKIGRLPYRPGILHILLESNGYRKKVTCSLKAGHGKTFYVEQESDDFLTSIDRVIEKLISKIVKQKKKSIARRHFNLKPESFEEYMILHQ